MWDHGLYFTVNDDDTPVFNTDLVSEYDALTEHLGFDAADLEQLNLNALEASFLPDGDKAELRQSFQSGFAALRAQQAT